MLPSWNVYATLEQLEFAPLVQLAVYAIRNECYLYPGAHNNCYINTCYKYQCMLFAPLCICLGIYLDAIYTTHVLHLFGILSLQCPIFRTLH